MADIRTKARGKGIRLTRDNQGKRVKKTNETLRKEINLRNLAAMKNRVTQAAATIRTCRQLIKNKCTCATKKSSPMMRRAPPPPPLKLNSDVLVLFKFPCTEICWVLLNILAEILPW